MNSRRAGNRSRSGGGMKFPYGDTGTDRTIKSSARQGNPDYIREHSGSDMRGHTRHLSHGSQASVGAYHGPGPVAGAGELMPPGSGPGPASRRKSGMAIDVGDGGPYGKNPGGQAPRGMRTIQSPE